MGTLLMAKPKAPKAPKKTPARSATDKPTAITVKGTAEWREWVNRGAKHCRTEVAKVVDAALVDYFKGRGFTEEAPER